MYPDPEVGEKLPYLEPERQMRQDTSGSRWYWRGLVTCLNFKQRAVAKSKKGRNKGETYKEKTRSKLISESGSFYS